MKNCIICGLFKPLEGYYKHKLMADGHLNKCITCTKRQSKEREEKLRKDPVWAEKEKNRARDKYHRLGYKDVHKPTYEMKKKAIDNYENNFPEKLKCRKVSHKIPVEKGFNKHHWSYNDEHVLDVIVLSIADHNTAHRFLVYDQEHYFYRRSDTMELLDSREKHENYINWILKPL